MTGKKKKKKTNPNWSKFLKNNNETTKPELLSSTLVIQRKSLEPSRHFKLIECFVSHKKHLENRQVSHCVVFITLFVSNAFDGLFPPKSLGQNYKLEHKDNAGKQDKLEQ